MHNFQDYLFNKSIESLIITLSDEAMSVNEHELKSIINDTLNEEANEIVYLNAELEKEITRLVHKMKKTGFQYNQILNLLTGMRQKVGQSNDKVSKSDYKSQLAAIKQHGFAIKNVDNPSEEMQLAAVNDDPLAIAYIKNPTEKVKLRAVNKDGFAINHIKDQSDMVKRAAVMQNGLAIQYVKNPTEDIRQTAIQQNPEAQKLIKYPHHVLLAKLEKNPYYIRRIKNPSEEMQLLAVKKDGFTIKHIENPSEEVQLAAVDDDPSAIGYIKNPTEKVKLAAIKKSPEAINYIRNPTQKALELHNKLHPSKGIDKKEVNKEEKDPVETAERVYKSFMNKVAASEYPEGGESSAMDHFHQHIRNMFDKDKETFEKPFNVEVLKEIGKKFNLNVIMNNNVKTVENALQQCMHAKDKEGARNLYAKSSKRGDQVKQICPTITNKDGVFFPSDWKLA